MTASIHTHKYSRLKKKIAILHSQFQIEIGSSKIGNKDYFRRLKRQKCGFSIKYTSLAVDYSFYLGSIN